MIKIDRNIKRLSDMGICFKKNLWVVDKKFIEYMEHYYKDCDRIPKHKLSLFERLYKWFKNKMEI